MSNTKFNAVKKDIYNFSVFRNRGLWNFLTDFIDVVGINMKIFKKYSPKHIARYVKAFFKGRIYIQGRGAYEFNHGKLIMLKDYQTPKHRRKSVRLIIVLSSLITTTKLHKAAAV